MNDAQLDLEAYLARIGYSGPRDPTLPVLTALHEHHESAIAFENLDVRLRRPIQLDLASLQDKLVARRRGGYCFEQNILRGHTYTVQTDAGDAVRQVSTEEALALIRDVFSIELPEEDLRQALGRAAEVELGAAPTVMARPPNGMAPGAN